MHGQGKRGQALMEYVLILVLAVIVVVALLALVGPALVPAFQHVSSNL